MILCSLLCRLNVAEIVCNLIKNLSPNVSGALMMSMGVNILAMLLNWYAVKIFIIISFLFFRIFSDNIAHING